MIIIDQFRISDDGQTMYIDAHVNKAKYFDDVYIGEVTIVIDEQLLKYCSSAVTDHYIYKETISTDSDKKKEIHLVLNKNLLNENFCKKDLSHDMFFLYVTGTGTPASDTPCRLDEKTIIGVTFDYNIIYNNALCYTRKLADTCNVPDDFIDFILKLSALKMAIETEHFTPAIHFFKQLTNQHSQGLSSNVRPCGCH